MTIDILDFTDIMNMACIQNSITKNCCANNTYFEIN